MPKPKPWWDQVVNNLQYELKQVQKDPVGAVAAAPARYAGAVGHTVSNAVEFEKKTFQKNPIDYIPDAMSRVTNPMWVTDGLTKQLSGGMADVGQAANVNAAQSLVVGNATKALIERAQGLGNLGNKNFQADYTRVAPGIDDAIDSSFSNNGLTPYSQLDEQGKNTFDAGASGLLNLELALAGSPLLAAGSKLPMVGGAVNAFSRLGDARQASTLLGGLTRHVFGSTIAEIPSTFLDDNRNGSAIGMFDPAMDPVKPGMSYSQAANNAFLPNVGFGLALSGGFAALGKLGKMLEKLPNTKRAAAAETHRSRAEAVRNEQEANGLIQTDEYGKTTFTEEALQTKPAAVPVPQVAGRIAELDPELAKTLNAEAVTEATGKTAEAPVEQVYDPSLPESDSFHRAVDSQLDDKQLLELYAQNKDYVASLDALIAKQKEDGFNPDARWDMVSAPTSSLAETKVPYSDQLGQVDTISLLSLADPGNSPELAQRITLLTGRDPEQFNRADVIAGIKAMEADGISVMPNRLMRMPMMSTSEIAIDPARFQFKANVDAQGQQIGNSLSGVERWNPGMENIGQVWDDPGDGVTYGINMHNRLALAKKLGIPSLRVEKLNSLTAEGARSDGALANIAQGGGTIFDAAKYMRENGITDPDELARLGRLGMPMSSGTATPGLALARLPDYIFLDAIDGRISQTKALALGGSGLDETQMAAAYEALRGRNLSDETFREVLQQAKNAPVIEGTQVDLFGNTDTLSLMVEKGRLAAAVRASLTNDKSLHKRVSGSAAQLEAAGNIIDAAATKQVGLNAEQTLGEFDATKYAEGTPVSQLLNEGALQIAAGGKVKPIADRIKRQIADAAATTPTPEAAAIPAGAADAADAAVMDKAMANLTPEQRKAVLASLTAKAAQAGEIRPPSTPLPKLPKPSGASLQKAADDLSSGVISEDVINAVGDELRLAEQHKLIDQALEADRVIAQREAIGYEDMTFEERKQHGMLDGVNKPPTPAAEVAPASAASTFTLPKELAGAKNNYRFGAKAFTIEFANDLDRTAYYLAGDATGKVSKAAQKYIDALAGSGLDPKEVAAYGRQVVKPAVKDMAKGAEPGVLKLDDQGFGGKPPAISTSMDVGGNANRGRAFLEEGRALRQKYRDDNALEMVYSAYKYGEVKTWTALKSEQAAQEMVLAIKEAARVSGLDPGSVRWLDTIDTRDFASWSDAVGAAEGWSPDIGRFARENPGDPLTNEVFQGTMGVYASKGALSHVADTISLALHPALDKRFGYKNALDGITRIGYHEAFHRVQEYLLGSEGIALTDPVAKAQMEKLVKSGGTWLEGMAQHELEAEAFSVYAQRRYNKELKSPAVFRKMLSFISEIRRTIDTLLKKDPTYVDVFDKAFTGDIAERAKYVNKLTPEQLDGMASRMDAVMANQYPELRQRVQDHLSQRVAEGEKLLDDWENRNYKEGC